MVRGSVCWWDRWLGWVGLVVEQVVRGCVCWWDRWLGVCVCVCVLVGQVVRGLCGVGGVHVSTRTVGVDIDGTGR